MIQLELFDNTPKKAHPDISMFARIFLKLFMHGYEDLELQEAHRQELIFFVDNCSDYNRGLYCEWVKYYSNEWEVNLGQRIHDRLDMCIASGGQRDALS